MNNVKIRKPQLWLHNNLQISFLLYTHQIEFILSFMNSMIHWREHEYIEYMYWIYVFLEPNIRKIEIECQKEKQIENKR